MNKAKSYELLDGSLILSEGAINMCDMCNRKPDKEERIKEIRYEIELTEKCMKRDVLSLGRLTTELRKLDPTF